MGYMKIKVPVFNKLQNVIYYMILYIFLMSLAQTFGMPHAIVFILDGVNLFLFVNLLLRHRKFDGLHYPLVKIQLAVWCLGILVSVAYETSAILISWSLRNHIRFVMFFISCVFYLGKNDICRIIKMLEIIYYINFIIYVVQFVFFHLYADMLGGIFGTIGGCNGYSNVFLVGITILYTWKWVYGKVKLKKLILILGMAVGQAALGEIKVFFVEVPVILIAAFYRVYFVNRQKRKINEFVMLIILSIVILIVGVWIVGVLRPEFKNFFTISKMLDIVSNKSGYSADGKSVNRLNAISIINSQIFKTVRMKMFGIGVGGAEYSQSVKAFISPFYYKFSYLKYKNFTISWLYIEAGMIGLVGYIMSFVMTIRDGYKRLKKVRDMEMKIIISTGITMTFICLILIIYSTSLRIDIAYLVYFFISLIYVNSKENMNEAKMA